MPRTIIVHLNIELPDSDKRTADEIADAITESLSVSSDKDPVRFEDVVAPLAEEV
jgi:hypothetical protein